MGCVAGPGETEAKLMGGIGHKAVTSNGGQAPRNPPRQAVAHEMLHPNKMMEEKHE